MKKLLLLILVALSGALTAWAGDYVELLTNGVCDGTFNGWTIENNGGDGWAIGEDEDGSLHWKSSYYLCTLEQTVSLAEKGFPASDIDAGFVSCKASADMRQGWEKGGKGASVNRIKVIMLDDSDNELQTQVVLDVLTFSEGWQSFEINFILPAGTRKLKYLVESQDAIFWLGQFGPCYKNLSLKVKDEGDGHDCEVDGHIWGDWTLTTPSTCTEPGVQTRSCLFCSETQTKPAPLADHVWNNAGVCTVCGLSASQPWGNDEGGWCGRSDVNGGKNVYYTITGPGDLMIVVTIRKSPKTVGDNCDINDYDNTRDIYQPWADVDYDSSTGISQASLHGDYFIIEEGVTGIGEGFLELFGETSVAIPSTVTHIGNYAFYENAGLLNVYCHANPNNLTWDESRTMDFRYNKGTTMHVYAEYLATYQEKFGDANVTFVGDLGTDGCSALGHLWGRWREPIPATCTEDGYRRRSCFRCGETETETILAYGHMWNDEGVCIRCGISDSTPWGFKKGGWCGRPDVNGGMNVYFVVTQNESNEEVLTIKKNPLAVGDNCDIANYNYSQFNPQPWLDIEYLEEGGIKMRMNLSHIVIEEGVTGIGEFTFATHSEKTVVIPSTLKRIGYYSFYANRSLTDIYCHANPDNLNWNNTRTSDFMSGKGTTMHVYAHFLDTYLQNFGDANVTYVGDLNPQDANYDCNLYGHFWGEWTQTTAPTCTKNGSHSHTCVYCGETGTESIPALGHDWENGGVCSRCGRFCDYPWGIAQGGWCGKTDVNGGMNVYYIITHDENDLAVITIGKNYQAVGNNCDIANYNYKQLNPQPWVNVVYPEDGGAISVLSTANYAFIEEGVTGIGMGVFEDHILFTAVIPSTVTRIDYHAFNGCTNLTDVYCLANPNKLYWNSSRAYDFNYNKATKMHVFSSDLATYKQKFGDANVTFVGDLDDFYDGIGSIHESEPKNGEENWYDLSGRMLGSKPNKHGLYIKNGKKVLK